MKKYIKKAIVKINDQKSFAVKLRTIAGISNKRKKIRTSSVSTIVFIKLMIFFV